MEGKAYSNDEITLKELIERIRSHFRYVKENWWVLVLSCIIFSAFFLYRHYTFVPTYNAELRFVVEGQNGVSGGLGGLLGTFGIKKGGSINPYKILEIGKSRKLFEKVVFSKFDEDLLMADVLLSEYELIHEWSKSSDQYLNFRFADSTLSREIERKVFKGLMALVWGSPTDRSNAIATFKLNEEKGIYTLSTSTPNEKLSILFTKRVYHELKQFFEDEVFLNQKRSAQILASKVDSINAKRISKTYELARFKDFNEGLVRRESSSREEVLRQEIGALGVAYAELIKNYEMTDVNLKDLQPLFMEIQNPMSPITPSRSSMFKNLLLGIIIGGFLAILFLAARKIYKELIK